MPGASRLSVRFLICPPRRIVLQFAELPREGKLLLVRDVLVRKHQNGVAVHSSIDRCDFIRVERLAALDPGDLGGEGRMQLAK